MTACDACERTIVGDSSSAYDINGDIDATICAQCARADRHAIAAAQDAEAQR